MQKNIEEMTQLQDKVMLSKVEVCIVCLATDRKMYPMVGNVLQDAYCSLLNEDVKMDNGVCMVCWECTAHLRCAARLQRKARIAHQLLIHMGTDEINKEGLESINRQEYELCSDLAITDAEILDLAVSEDSTIKQEYENDESSENEISEEGYPLSFFKVDVDSFKTDESVGQVPVKNDVKTEGHDIVIETTERCKRGSMRYSSIPAPDIKMKGLDPLKNGSKLVVILAIGFKTRKLTPHEQVLEFEKRKYDERYLSMEYKCDLCYRGLSSETQYYKHMERHKEERGQYVCHICKLRMQTKQKVKMHIYRSHSEEFQCNQCEFVTSFKTQAHYHFMWHTGRTYKCPQCPTKFSKYSTYMNHRRLKHLSKHVCDVCGKSFVSKLGLHMHKSKMHWSGKTELEGPYCPECDVSFASKNAFQLHLTLSTNHSSAEDMRQVLVRTRDPWKNRRYSMPPKSKTPRSPITCEVCEAVVLGVTAYGIHFRRKHPGVESTQFHVKRMPAKTIVCDQCGKKFECYAKLRDHMLVHAGHRPLECDFCKKRFFTKSTLMIHMEKHMGSRHKCDACGKTFHNACNLRRHQFIHTGLRPFKCSFCDKSYNQNTTLQLHIKHVHHNVPWPSKAKTHAQDSQ